MPSLNPEHRDAVKEVIEREDMIKRRSKLHIPEFYVGMCVYISLAVDSLTFLFDYIIIFIIYCLLLVNDDYFQTGIHFTMTGL